MYIYIRIYIYIIYIYIYIHTYLYYFTEDPTNRASDPVSMKDRDTVGAYSYFITAFIFTKKKPCGIFRDPVFPALLMQC